MLRAGLRVWRVTVLVLALLLGPAAAAGAAPRGNATAVPAGTSDGRSRLTMALPGPAAPDGGTPPVAVTVDGRPVPADVAPLLSERTATALVVDTSGAGAAALQPGLSGAADFVLAAPPAARSALVTDTSPPVVAAPLQVGPAGTLHGLAEARAGGDRQTGAALDLALAQLPAAVDGPRLVLLYTGVADVPAPPADLAARLTAAGAVLAVVVPADDGAVPPYWAQVAAATGGAAVAGRPSGVVAAFDALSSTLRTRYLVSFPAPARFPAQAAVRVDTPTGPVTVDAAVPAPAGAPPASTGPRDVPAGVALGIGAALLAALALGTLVMTFVVRRRRSARPAAAAPAWNIPRRPDPVVDRAPQAAAVRGALHAGRPAVLTPVDDDPGLGTTTAMIEFAHRGRADYDIAWWVPAADAPLVADRLAELAEVLGLAGPADTAETATERLLAALRDRRRWLLIFDDAGSPRQLTRFLPDGHGHVLIGSPDPEWAEHAAAVPVRPFTRTESTDLLRARRPGLSTTEADRLAAALKDVPLAVDLAGATLLDTAMSVESYLRLLPAHRPAEAACAVALDRLATDDPAATTLLTLLAWLGPDPVPHALLTARPALLPDPLPPIVAAPDRWAALLAVVGRRGLARVDGATVTLHRVPAGLLVARSDDDAARWAATAVRLLRDALPEDPTDPAGRATWRLLLPHVLVATDPGRPLDDVHVEVGWLLHHAGRHLHERGEPRAARALFEDAHDLYRSRLGPDHPDTQAVARALTPS